MKYIFLLMILPLLLACTASAGTEINNYEECIAAGYPMLKTYPARCATPDGKVFVDAIKDPIEQKPNQACVDKCGDGVCQEIVCMATHCPCAENKSICPSDCMPKVD